MSTKNPTQTTPAFARRPDLSRQITSEHISEHMAAFEAAGAPWKCSATRR